jgi:hypothetical protein
MGCYKTFIDKVNSQKVVMTAEVTEPVVEETTNINE